MRFAKYLRDCVQRTRCMGYSTKSQYEMRIIPFSLHACVASIDQSILHYYYLHYLKRGSKHRPHHALLSKHTNLRMHSGQQSNPPYVRHSIDEIYTCCTSDGCSGRMCCMHFLMGNEMKGAVFLFLCASSPIDNFNPPYLMFASNFDGCNQKEKNNNKRKTTKNKPEKNNAERNSNLRKVNNIIR